MDSNKTSGAITVEGIHYSTGKPIRVKMQDGIFDDIIDIQSSESKCIIAPGFIDNQVNGYVGVDFSGEELDRDGIQKVTEALWKVGVTSYLPTLITNSQDNLMRNFNVLSSLPEKSLYSQSIIGYHLEGPYISPVEGFVGCHPLEHVRNPDWEEFMELQEAAKGKIIQVTLAPEMPGAMDFIRKCIENSIVVALGHTNANVETIMEAVQLGPSLSTHLGNGCPAVMPRHHNPIWSQLDQVDLTATIIADGHHLPPELLRIIFKVKGVDHLVLTSDMTFPAGMKPGRYFFGGSEVELKDSGRLESVSNDCLAGASFPLKTGVENMMKFVGCTLSEAIDMASKNPVRIYGLSDRGVLKVGKRADIILFDLENDQIDIKETYLTGQKVFSRS